MAVIGEGLKARSSVSITSLKAGVKKASHGPMTWLFVSIRIEQNTNKGVVKGMGFNKSTKYPPQGGSRSSKPVALELLFLGLEILNHRREEWLPKGGTLSLTSVGDWHF